MSAATLVAPVTTPRQAQPRRSLDHVYPLFGFRREVHYVPLLHRQAEIDGWLLRQDNREPNEPWTSRWRRCQRECRSAFKQIWVVRLPRQSRSLTPGDYVFDPLTDFLNLPGSPPPGAPSGVPSGGFPGPPILGE